LTGELALTYHYRKPDLSSLQQIGSPTLTDRPTEQRYAFDMRWDIEFGFWVEIVAVELQTDISFLSRWKRFINIGSDYTFSIGNGLGVTGEYFEIGEPSKIFGSCDPVQFIAGSTDYPLGIADKIKGIFYFDLERSESYAFIAFIHTLDNWQFSLNGFRNPPFSTLNYDSGSMLAGNGIQVTVTYNH
jgi:hypothetical protein